MTLPELAKIESGILADMARRGDLGPREVWTALKGSTRYLKAAASGDIALPVTQVARVRTCDECPSATYRHVPAARATAIHCGPAFHERPETCGCLVGVTVGGVVTPAGKTVVASEACPQSKW